MFDGLMSYDSKDIFKNEPYLIYYLIMTPQIWKIIGWLKIQKLEYLENET